MSVTILPCCTTTLVSALVEYGMGIRSLLWLHASPSGLFRPGFFCCINRMRRYARNCTCYEYCAFPVDCNSTTSEVSSLDRSAMLAHVHPAPHKHFVQAPPSYTSFNPVHQPLPLPLTTCLIVQHHLTLFQYLIGSSLPTPSTATKSIMEHLVDTFIKEIQSTNSPYVLKLVS